MGNNLELEQMLLTQLQREVQTLKWNNTALNNTIKEKELKISELKIQLKKSQMDAERKLKVRNAISQMKLEDFISEDEDGCEYIYPGMIEEIMDAFVEKYDAL